METGLIVQIRFPQAFPQDLTQKLCQGSWGLLKQESPVLTLVTRQPRHLWDQSLYELERLLSDLLPSERELLHQAEWEVMPLGRYNDLHTKAPKRVGRSWCILGPETPRNQSKNTIFMNPGWAFGEGCHPTTQGCIFALEYLNDQGLIRNKNILDVGTGTGILGIIAGKMGAKEVLCLDVDQEALNVASENVRCNALEKRVAVADTPLHLLAAAHWHVAMANLTVSVLLRLFEDLVKRLRSGGHIVLSGFSRSQVVEINKLANNYGLQPSWSRELKRWVTLILKRKG